MQSQTGQYPRGVGTFYAGLLVYLLVSPFLGGIGWSAAIWTVTKQSVSEPAPFGRAMAFGLRRCPRVGGWLLLYTLMFTVGLACCILPGLYFGLAGSLVIPIAVFRAGGGIGESFRMVHRSFGAALGRVATLVGLTRAAGVIAFILGQILGAVLGSGDFAATATSGTLGIVIGLPASILLIIGIMLTYTELVAREYPTSAAALSASL